MAGKNFLDQFSTDNKPDSFKEEVFVPSKQPKKPLNITVIIIFAVIVLLGGFLSWFFLLRPTIEMPSFIGKEESDVAGWIRQQGIQSSGIKFDEEYNEDYASKLITYQSIEPGKKVKKDVKIDFTISKGPDPNVEIKVPDIISMNLTEINSWIDTNKLTGVKIQSEFSDEDPLDSVISFEFGSNASETNFKRSSSLTIVVSKGKQEDQPISVPNFSGKNISEVKNWGSKNKIKIVEKEDYSSTVNKDMIISQSVNPGKKITSKESLTVTVSKGAPIIAPDFSSYSEANILAWGTKNGVNIEIIRKYNKDVEKDKVIEQSIKDKACNDGMSVTISLGNIHKDDFTGNSLDALKNWINEVNAFGAGVSTDIDIDTRFDDEIGPKQLITIENVSVGSRIKAIISRGKNIFVKDYTKEATTISWPSETDIASHNRSEEDMRNLCESNELTCTFTYNNIEGDHINKITSIKRSDNGELPVEGIYIPQDVTITINIDTNKE